VDHSEVAELIAAGTITAEQARTHPKRNVVTRSLGTQPAPRADIWVLPAVEGERFLICSDGLPLELTEVAMADELGREIQAQVVADTLVEQAVSAGGRDNVSAVVVDVLRTDVPSATDIATAPRAALQVSE
jgi:serine/threonine protein phosphatase PrpC